jgi:hypothetical protein
MRRGLIAMSLGMLGMALAVSPALGQGHGRTMFTPGNRGTTAALRHGATGHHFVRARHGHRVFAGAGLGPNYYPGYYDDYDDYDSDGGRGEVLQPPIPHAVAPAPATPVKSPEALVMELRGDHWVRLTGMGAIENTGQSGGPQSEQGSGGARRKGPVASVRAQEIRELPPAVLVFRDGHQEEAAKYTIVGSTIYLKGDYWSTGEWTRRVAIAELNLAATLQANQARGANFSLPSRPSEVIVRW